jgi:ribosomal protein RSM22 (predicted rRNA methylase)
MPFRLSYHDLAARATESVPRERLARAIEKLSAAYRDGRSIESHKTRDGRAAYLVHTLPAHVCDVRRLILDELETEVRKDALRVLALGAGPGTEALALAEAWATLAARDGARPGASLTVERVDQVGAWDEAFEAMRRVFEPALLDLDPTFGESWTWQTPATIVSDLSRSPGAALEAAKKADLIFASNLVSEILPRGTSELPSSFLDVFASIGESAREGAACVLLDRAHAPGVVSRLEAAAKALGARRRVVLSDIYEREVRCSCALTRRTKELYAKVSLPTTKVEDRPIGNTRTAWTIVRLI